MSVPIPRAVSLTPAEPIDRDGAIPPLENGDRLTRSEFERRYDAMPNLKNAELIEGVVYLRLMIPHRQHGEPHFHLTGWLGFYSAYTPGVEGGNSCHIRMDWDNMPQPDCVLFLQPEWGGQATIDADGYLAGAPDLIGEVTSSSASYDLHNKFQVYRRNGVREYIVWRVLDRQIDWFVHQEGRYDLIPPAADGILRSTVFPGLWLDPAALVRDDLDTLMGVLQRGLDSPEHAEFAARRVQARAEPEG